jgi:hypothetical protein
VAQNQGESSWLKVNQGILKQFFMQILGEFELGQFALLAGRNFSFPFVRPIFYYSGPMNVPCTLAGKICH